MHESLIQQPLAIVGMACRLPQVDSLDAYWRLLVEGRSAIGPLGPRVLDRKLHYDPRKGIQGKTYSSIGGMIAGRPVDLSLLGLDAGEASAWDECHLIFAEVATQAWQHAGYSRSQTSKRDVGVYIGHSGGSRKAGELIYSTLAESTAELLRETPGFEKLSSVDQNSVVMHFVKQMQERKATREANGRPYFEASAAARLVAKVLDLSGPQMVLDAACASSLVALGLAAIDLQAGNVDAAIVGGASYNKVDSLILFSQAQSCSATASRPFDERADGLIASEGYIALIIKTLDRAIEDQDEIWGVLGGLGIATDGRGKSLWAPRREGQYSAMKRAYENTVDPKRVQFVEAHATSTQVGDATEAQALSDFYGPHHELRSLPIGSVKSNVGHTLETAGLAGLLKTVLAMKHGKIPPTVNLTQPSSSIDWKSVPFYVPTEAKPWPAPKDGTPRCGAVNAFGIGGLNVHVVVEQFQQAYHRRERYSAPKTTQEQNDYRHEPIAIVGVGVIVPGAQGIVQLEELIASKRCKLINPPESRWRKRAGTFSSSKSVSNIPFEPTTNRGGYLVDYAYDWKKHKVPPKQVDRANPLQFMLLDAASQTLSEAAVDRQASSQPRTSVIVGTTFGGEFGHQLQLGLRLSELEFDLRNVLAGQPFDEATIDLMVENFIDRMLHANPALLDETGSFTSSTLASRITKQFNLMGGAMAIDAGDASGEAALSAACGLLRAGTSDAVLCAAGQRALDLPAYQNWQSRNQIHDDPNNPQLPGEGTVVFHLKRLSDAKKVNDKVFAIVEHVELNAAATSSSPSSIERQVGDLKSAKVLLDIASSIAEAKPGRKQFHSRNELGVRYTVTVTIGDHKLKDEQTADVFMNRSQTSEEALPALMHTVSECRPLKDATEAQWSSPRRKLVTAVFPGQGSQSLSMLQPILARSLAARQTLAEADQILKRIGSPNFETLCQMASTNNTTEVIWAIQGSMLIADMVFAASFHEQGIQADIVLGHSLGELAAMVFAGAWSMPDAIEFVQLRAAAVVRHAQLDTGLLSIGASAEDVQLALRSIALPISLTHDNSPRQAVVGGRRDHLQVFQDSIRGKRWSNVMLNVPVAFHTAMMANVQLALVECIQGVRIRPPRVPIMSTVSGRLVSDPDEIRRNVLEQLTAPILYRTSIEQIERWGGTCFIEVGPGNVLTKLNQAILKSNSASAMAMVDANDLLSMVDKSISAEWQQSLNPAIPGSSNTRTDASAYVRRSMQTPIVVVDATELRRKKRREQASQGRGNTQVEKIVDDPIPLYSDVMPQVDNSTLVSPTNGSASLEMTKPTGGKPIHAADLEAFVRDFIVEHTGYPPEMIELDWDLEADLGIDSIKQVQLFGELRELFEVDPERLSAGQVRSIRQIVELLATSGGKREWLDSENAPHHSDNTVQPTEELPPSTSANESPLQHYSISPTDRSSPRPQSTHSRNDIAEFMIDFVIEHTGYPREIVDLDADFEADLGLDSIKLAQLFGELRSNFDFPTSTDRSSIAKCRTLNSILELFPQDSHSQSETDELIENLIPLSDSVSSDTERSYSQGLAWGQANAMSIEARLIDNVNRIGKSSVRLQERGHSRQLEVDLVLAASSKLLSSMKDELAEPSWWRGLADGAELDEDCVLGSVAEIHLLIAELGAQSLEESSSTEFQPDEGAITQRYELCVEESPLSGNDLSKPELVGSAIVVGSNAQAAEMVRSFEKDGIRCVQLDSKLSIEQLKSQLDRAWSVEPVLHLILATPHDSEAAIDFSSQSWKARSTAGMTSLFWLCQHWLNKVIAANQIQRATLTALTRLGGDFGIGNMIIAPESGALTGLLKAIVIENWVNGHRGLAVKIIDSGRMDTPASVASYVRKEMAHSSYDMEISWAHGIRKVVRAYPKRISRLKKLPVTRGGNWIFTGGGRGITAFVAEELALRYDLTLQLIGTAPVPNIPASWRNLDENGTRSLKLEIMQEARRDKRPDAVNPIKAWQNVEKAIEIETTLARMRSRGIRVEYHCCDCSDATALNQVMSVIRKKYGPIRGCLHGAGVGQDARFDRKRPDKVRECLGAKIDGSIALMDATRQDPLEFFIGFGSISGRFGANGHTDYSMANDGLAKCIGWYRAQRPEVKAVCFHWHAWGDIGMATKPETKLALEMIDMQFMPAQEGLDHLIREIEGGAPRSEVLITDDRYYRMFYPAETVQSEDRLAKPVSFALLEKTQNTCWLDPLQDVFLREHCLDKRPLLPMVIGLELLVEAVARKHDWVPIQFGGPLLVIRDFESFRGLRFFDDERKQVRLEATESDAAETTIELKADFCARNGNLVEPNRLHMRAIVSTRNTQSILGWKLAQPTDLSWQDAGYPPPDAPFFVGPAFRVLKRIAILDDKAYGVIQAPSLIELAGNKRDVTGWRTPSALLDACLFATGVLAWNHVRPGINLPVRFDEIMIHKMPKPGESCWLETRCVGIDDRSARFDFSLWGSDGRLVLEAVGYRTAWVESR
jgi:acyl transferase domain-containing protein/acyl carrier protein/NAD(P)-dependent dehydrogenase (short-subunit alcohol dehydrogenase family)